MINRIRLWWFHWHLKRWTRKADNPRAFVSLKEANNLAALVYLDGPEAVDATLQWQGQLEKMGKQVVIEGYVPVKKPAFDIPFPYYTPESVSFTFKPKGWANQDTAFDILLFVAPYMPPVLAHIAAHSHSKMRVGPHSQRYQMCLDYMISLPASATMATIFDTFDKYLKMLSSDGNHKS